ncbi:hypothetical protein ACQQCD_07750 [Pseudarthrobacter sp. J1763]|uniref:hypothetical protein n=1 Tax=Pseudarthrobacter sp. J1763 TaxID=3420445 RepID=UPI003D28CC09
MSRTARSWPKSVDAILGALWGIISAGVGLLPWLMAGARLPLQNLWATETMPEDMPIALLPVSQYSVILILAMFVSGAVIAALGVRNFFGARRRPATAFTVAGLALVQLVAVVQAFSVVSVGLAPGRASTMYLTGLLAAAVISAAVGLLIFMMLLGKHRWLPTVGFALAAVPLASWVVEWMVQLSPRTIEGPFSTSMVYRWLPAILVGVSLAWCGLKPAALALVWVANLAFLWAIPALVTATQSTLGTRNQLGDFEAMGEIAVAVLKGALGPAGGAIYTVLLALGIAVAGLLLQRFVPTFRGNTRTSR